MARRDYEFHQTYIRDALIRLLEKNKGRLPTLRELHEETKFSVRIISKHIKGMQFKPADSILKTLTPDVMLGIFKAAVRGHSANAKLWMQIVEGWVERTELTAFDNPSVMYKVGDKEVLSDIDAFVKGVKKVEGGAGRIADNPGGAADIKEPR